jgi:FkbM family methyltransferase
MRGATGNIYCGLHEFADMAFLLHLLRPQDLFVDVGANVGSYSVLASAVVGAHTIAAEPDPHTMIALRRNIAVNDVTDRVHAIETAVGREAGTARFSVGLDTINHVVTEGNSQTRDVAVETLDNLLRGSSPTLIKLDVEGHEADVVAGANETLLNPSLLAIETEGTSSVVTKPLIGAGFTRVYYDPFSRRMLDEPTFAHSNALFVRDRDTVQRRVSEAPLRRIYGRQI